MPNLVGNSAYVEIAPSLIERRGLETVDGRSMEELGTEFAAKICEAEQGDTDQTDSFRHDLGEAIAAGRIVPGTPLWRRILSAHAHDGSVGGACTVVSYANSGSREKVLRALAAGSGVGIDLSDEHDPVGALTALNADVLDLDNRLRAEDRRPVACMATLSSPHPAIMDFVRMKREADFMSWRFNLSVRVEDYHAEHADLLAALAENAHFCGEPGVLFWDRVDEMTATPTMPPESTAPCAEVALAEGEQCMFAYLNLIAYVRDGVCDFELLERDSAIAAHLLDNATHICLSEADEKSSWRLTRRTGVGAMGYADACIAAGLRYGSSEAVQLARGMTSRLFVGATRESIRLAKERGAFPIFEQSKYQDQGWLRDVYTRCLRHPDSVDTSVADDIVNGINRYGIRNSSCVAFPPTGNASELTGVSKSVEPRRSSDDLAAGIEVLRRYGAIDDDPESSVLVTEDEISASQHVEVQAAFQAASIDAVSKTVNLPNSASVDDVRAIFDYAYATGCKGITVFRDGCLSERL